jgi:asparagine synthase (glutamine-hydrolysing)
MCGIAGILGSKAGEHQDAVRRMLGAMAHRGPDGSGLWASPTGRCVLGHARLAVLDLTEAAAQPMATRDGRHVLVYNGECYNFPEVRRELERQGTSFRSSGDTEVVLQALARRGRDALADLNAMFGLALWDDREGTLLLARDRFGQKPLYWAPFEDGAVFASELRAVLASGLIPRRVKPTAVRAYLCHGSVQGPESIVTGVRLLPRAASLVLRPGGEPDVVTYWQPSREKTPASPDELRRAFLGAVGRHLVSDVPLGVFLSGGVDSSAIAAAACRHAGGRVVSLSVIFPGNPAACEAEHARRMARHAGTEHVEVPLTGQDLLGVLDEALAALDQPTVDAVNTYVVSRAARAAGLTVALSGLGGDELFGGYGSFADVPRLLRVRRSVAAVRRPARWLLRGGAAVGRRRAKVVDLLEAPGGVLAAYVVRRRLFSSAQVRALAPALAGDDWCSGFTPAGAAELRELIAGRPLPDAVAHLELAVYMAQTLLRDTDAMGMASGLEIRAPFLDTEFADLALAQPEEARLPRAVRKWLLVEAIRDWLPEANWRRPKQGFGLPFEPWLLGALRGRVEEEIASLAQSTGLFAGGPCAELWDRFTERPAEVGWSRPWALFVLGSYLRRHKLVA